MGQRVIDLVKVSTVNGISRDKVCVDLVLDLQIRKSVFVLNKKSMLSWL